MHIETIRAHCFSKPGFSEGFPFGDGTLVFKVGGRMFLLANLDGPLMLNLKANPEDVLDRVERFAAVRPGYHMNKKHWITVDVVHFDDDRLLLEWIDESYALIYMALPSKMKIEINLTNL